MICGATGVLARPQRAKRQSGPTCYSVGSPVPPVVKMLCAKSAPSAPQVNFRGEPSRDPKSKREEGESGK